MRVIFPMLFSVAALAPVAAESSAEGSGQAGAPGGGPYNILFILTDQERYFDPSAFSVQVYFVGPRTAPTAGLDLHQPLYQLRGLHDHGCKPNFMKRGAIRSMFDGRYTYSRYFSPKQHNQPRTLEGIFELNDVELFDLEADPDEMQNLSTEPKKHGNLMLAMNDEINQLIGAEVGVDDGSFLPGEDVDWAATTFDP